MKVSREGVVLIKSFEGFRARAVRGEGGRWIIGYGHSASAREGLTIGEPDAELLLQYDLLPVVKALNERAPTDLNQHQFDALASFAISVGVDRFLASDVLQRLNEGHAGEAADALVGWPATTTPDDRLRRRAAERALFVADPATAVTLADLLAAPLPPPPVEMPPVAPVSPEADSPTRSSAAPVTPLSDAPPSQAEPIIQDPSWTPAPPAFEASGFEPADAVTTVNMNRYSPYAATTIGPLPGFDVVPSEPAEPAPEVEPALPTEPLAGPEPVHEPIPADSEVPVVPLESPAPAPSPFPPMEQTLVLTPATEADFGEAERPAWPSDQRPLTPPAEASVLFEDGPTLSVLRHEVEPASPRRFDWSETGAFLIMGGVGLAACAASAAAFRLSVEQPSPMGETTVLAWALALIGVICVGLSSWNLYVRWGKTD